MRNGTDARQSTRRTTLWRGFAVTALAAIVVAGCSSAAVSPTPNGPQPTNQPAPSGNSPTAAPTTGSDGLTLAVGRSTLADPAPDRGQAAAAEINDFGFDLLRALDSKGNLVASPASIALALGMVRPGAKGQTATEMDKVLHGFGAAGSESEIAALLQTYGAQTVYVDSNGMTVPADQHGTLDPAVELDVADQAFIQEDLNVEMAYLDELHSGFNAGVALVDYKHQLEPARQLINKWASDQTKGRIPTILEKGDIDESTRLVLVNAIYLKAAWETEFDASQTANRTFTTADGTAEQVPTMAIDASYQYGAGNGYQSVTLPYTLGNMSMTIVEPDDMAAFVKGLTADSLASLIASQSKAEVDLTLPRFSIQTRIGLAKTLEAMGMPTAFDSTKADFTGITTDRPSLYIGNVIHEANIDVVEKGTTAAAVTAVVMEAGAAPAQPQKATFHVDKPFLYFITDRTSGSVLFMGRVSDPASK